MSPATSPKAPKVGGEYGDIRGPALDAQRLNEYLAKHVPAIQGPVDVKQFKASMFLTF